ncbi:hypothetical protein [Coraliomargarita akajimensis]|uniref:PEP-CTERM protein-sorting domain-containing protein n=1 Tax=Coraliomargarita akajimensis (strain DSM 45221 / IAM 15411 / JCM 23193 / KCTC 12865 / 04OKA010-24) TaxID=583355 RepID=D5EL02_CORAD|nr:hypothetical protein [Coraliomargarita akajimensis]ADE53104.1 protein of unknown function DUF1555 [Coraliomargarita akajimensis DSM 45221]
MRQQTKLALLALTLGFSVPISQLSALGLTLTIDLSTEELFITGEDTGTPFSTILGSGAVWEQLLDHQVPVISHYLFEPVDLSSSLTSTGNTVTNFQLYYTFPSHPVSGDLIFEAGIDAAFSSGVAGTLTGTGTRVSYAGQSSDYLQFIEILSTAPLAEIPFTQGSGFSAIAINVIPVPEPSASVAIVGLTSLLIVGTRRRNRSDNQA